jgi:YebC/PmpR family DNA-binding regulatory protein
MSGHSKWATIKHKKAALDAKRGKSFTRIIKEITIAARSGGDPDGNPRLRTAILAAKAVSMPADNIKKAVMRGTGELEGGQIEEVMFEGYGPGGAAVLVNVATDNRNRTVSDIRHAFSKNGGNMGEQGSVAWMFERKSQIFVPARRPPKTSSWTSCWTPAPTICATWATSGSALRSRSHESVLKALEAGRHSPEEASIAMVPKNLIKLEGKNASRHAAPEEALEEHDDVQSVYSNFDIDEKELEALSQ